MKKLIAFLVIVICLGSPLIADVPIVPETIPVGVEAVKAYQLNTVNQYVVNVFGSTNFSNPNDKSSFKVIAAPPWRAYTATNGVLDETFIREQIRKVSQVALTKDPTMLFATYLMVDTTNHNAYAKIESVPFRLVLGGDGKYSLPAEATNSALIEFPNVGFYVKGITRARVELTDWTGSYDILDSSLAYDSRSIDSSHFYCPRWLLMGDGYEGTIYLYTGTGASATVTRYDLATGQKIPPLRLSAPRHNIAGKAEVTITGSPGTMISIQCSSDFVNWVNKGTITLPANGTIIFVDEKESHNCFFRAVETRTQ